MRDLAKEISTFVTTGIINPALLWLLSFLANRWENKTTSPTLDGDERGRGVRRANLKDTFFLFVLRHVACNDKSV